MKGVHGVHEASLPYQRHARLFCPNGNYTAHNWRSVLGSQQEGKKMDGGMRRRDIKGKLGWGYNWLGLSGYVNTAHLFN